MKLALGLIAVVGAMLAASPVRPSAQSIQSLAALTVPIERLPSECRLEPVDPNATGAARFVMYPGIRENPWVGLRYASSIRQLVDGPGGPQYGLSGPALYSRLAEDVVEAYRARYIAAGRQKVEVYAVRFNDPALTLAASLTRLIADPPQHPRIVFGATAVLVFQSSERFTRPGSGDADQRCLQAVTEHILSFQREARR